MIGFDLDDTLARVDFNVFNKAMLMAHYKDAKVLYVPSKEFVVITARPTDNQTRYYTEKWLKDNQPMFKRLYMVGGGTEAEIVQKKADIINGLKLTEFYDNNTGILKALKPLLTEGTVLYHMVDGKASRY